MTYTVSNGTLNSTIPYHTIPLSIAKCDPQKNWGSKTSHFCCFLRHKIFRDLSLRMNWVVIWKVHGISKFQQAYDQLWCWCYNRCRVGGLNFWDRRFIHCNTTYNVFDPRLSEVPLRPLIVIRDLPHNGIKWTGKYIIAVIVSTQLCTDHGIPSTCHSRELKIGGSAMKIPHHSEIWNNIPSQKNLFTNNVHCTHSGVGSSGYPA